VSLAAIGYHFGSKDALMNQALYESIGDWGDEVERALSEEGVPTDDPLRRFESIMDRTIASFGGPGGGLWAAQNRAPQPARAPRGAADVPGSVQRDAADGLAELFLGIDPAQDPESARTAGSLLHAMFIGIIGQVVHESQAGAVRARARRGDCGSSRSTWHDNPSLIQLPASFMIWVHGPRYLRVRNQIMENR